MTPQIPSFKEVFTAVRDINLAAVILADDRTPRLRGEQVSKSVDGVAGRERYLFKFPNSEASNSAHRIWRAWELGESKLPDSPVATCYRAFRYCDLLTTIIKSGECGVRPFREVEGAVWTVNTKVAATAIAVAIKTVLPLEKLRYSVLRDGKEYGFLVKDKDVLAAYADPEGYIASHPDAVLSYVVAAFYVRERLRDIVKAMPARHVFTENDEVYFVAEPNQPTQEIHQ